MWHCLTSINSNVSNFFSAIMQVIHVTSSSFLFFPLLFLFFLCGIIIITWLVIFSLCEMRLWWKHITGTMWLFTFKWQSGSETLQYEQCIILHWHVTVTCSSRSFLTMVSLKFSFVQETTSKRQQSKCFCQWTTMLNVWLQIACTCNQKYKQEERRLWQTRANIFCECVGVHMYKSAWKLTTHYCMYVWIYCCFQVQWQSQINRSSHVSEEIFRKAHYIHVLYGKFTWSWILTSPRWTQHGWSFPMCIEITGGVTINCTAMSGRCLQEFLTSYLNSQSV